MNKQKIWWQIEIKDPEYLSGKSLIKLLKLINKIITVNFLVIDDIDGIVPEKLRINLPKIMSLSEFIKLGEKSIQFDFGTFYLFSEKNKAKKLIQQILSMRTPNLKFFHKTITKALTTVQAFDDESFFVYTKEKKIMGSIKRGYPQAKIQNKNLEQLEFYE